MAKHKNPTRKKAVIIGINYTGTENELQGCINDANNIAEFIKTHYGFITKGTVILTDDGHGDGLPTKENILKAMRWLVEDAGPNDSLFFHYSGHGDRQWDEDGDEADGFDEIILPLDYEKKGVITDDKMNEIMVRPLPKGCQLTAIFDCSHSGSALDLPYIYNEQGKLSKFVPELNIQPHTTKESGFRRFINRLCRKKSKSVTKVSRIIEFPNDANVPEKGSLGDVVLLSSCRDSELSVDAKVNLSQRTGLLTYAVLNTLMANPYNTSYYELLSRIQYLVNGKFSQAPQLSSSHPMNMEAKFLL
ncbi:Ca(2+)-dependent cysteine protease [Entomophthora muscae]|uniref:Ca(2+)-dependent cysteine protease n=1 Tax=Entomophthora muscae TaxID=34485 RepID=A0ACC2T6M7_9FUNG|nr:Ca(2+)-dependent cysteine protease [Entomophthora muscae]